MMYGTRFDYLVTSHFLLNLQDVATVIHTARWALATDVAYSVPFISVQRSQMK